VTHIGVARSSLWGGRGGGAGHCGAQEVWVVGDTQIRRDERRAHIISELSGLAYRL